MSTSAVLEREGAGPVPSLLNDRFEVLLWLGTSDRTSDFVGYDRLDGQSVVVRILSQDLAGDALIRDRLGGLFPKLASLRHGALAPIVDWGCCDPGNGFDPVHFVVTRPPDRPTLHGLIEERGPVPTVRAVVLRASIDDLVLDLRREGVTPCDLRADSMWIAKGGRVLVDPVDLALDVACRSEPLPNAEASHHWPVELRDAAESVPSPRMAPNKVGRAGRRLRLPVVSVALLVTSWVGLAPPKWGGQTTYTVVAGRSMEPGFHTGDLVVLRRSGHYGKGDVVTYSVPEDPYRSFNVVHRIVDELPDGRFVMRGDNRDAADPWLITRSDIRGKKILLIAKGGLVLVFLSSPLGFALVFGALVTAWFWGSPSLTRRT